MTATPPVCPPPAIKGVASAVAAPAASALGAGTRRKVLMQSGVGMLHMFSNTAMQAGQRGPYQTEGTSTVKRLRLSKGLTKPQAAKLAGVGLRTYERCEACSSQVSRTTLRKIERALGLPW